MTREGWIFMIGFRVFDIGLLVVWLIWFFRLRDSSGEEPDDDDGGGGGGTPPKRSPRGPGGGGLRLPDGRVPAGTGRSRDGHRPRQVPHHRRPAPPIPAQMPARVRSPGAPARVTRRASLGKGRMDPKLEVVPIPVSHFDAARAFYAEQVGSASNPTRDRR